MFFCSVCNLILNPTNNSSGEEEENPQGTENIPMSTYKVEKEAAVPPERKNAVVPQLKINGIHDKGYEELANLDPS